jgi:FkbM family methyltransferase
VIAFEPNPTMVRELEHNVQLNGLQNVTVKPFALSSETGESAFYCPPAGFEGHEHFVPTRAFQHGHHPRSPRKA